MATDNNVDRELRIIQYVEHDDTDYRVGLQLAIPEFGIYSVIDYAYVRGLKQSPATVKRISEKWQGIGNSLGLELADLEEFRAQFTKAGENRG